MMGRLEKYLQSTVRQSKQAIAFLAALDHLEEKMAPLASAIVQELDSQRSSLKLIASENYSSLAVQLAMGNLLTDKYAEGVPGRRFYAGCEHVDAIEAGAVAAAKRIFSCQHAYVQPHSGADANLVALFAILVEEVQKRWLERVGKSSVAALDDGQHEVLRGQMMGQKLMAMSLDAGGHLSHGYRHHLSSKLFQVVSYGVDRDSERLDYELLAEQVRCEKPLVLLAGYSSYPRFINFARMREIADQVGAVLLTDMAHFSGLVAGGVLQGEYDPVPYSDLLTSTTHKLLRGPRGGMVLCRAKYREVVDKGCPFVLGGPLPHVIAAKGVAFAEILGGDYAGYARQVVANGRALAEELLRGGVRLVTGGTDHHLLLLDVQHSFGLSGMQAEGALRRVKILVNRNAIPFDGNGVWDTSGIRLGSAAVTTLGMGEEEMRRIAGSVIALLRATRPKGGRESCSEQQVVARVQGEVAELRQQFPLYPELLV